MIELVTDVNIEQAAAVHALSWRESHRAVCTEEFIALHTAERQRRYFQSLIETGAAVYLLSDNGRGVGTVSVRGNLIGDLYVLPEEQRKGYGTELLRFALERCTGVPTLWVLDHNRHAVRFYERNGFRMTGVSKELSAQLAELEMKYD